MSNMIFEMKLSKSHIEIFFNNDKKNCTFHHFYTSDHITLLNIPKCASTSLLNYFNAIKNLVHHGNRYIVFLRDPLQRIKSAFKMKCRNEYSNKDFSYTISKYQNFLFKSSVPYQHYNDMIHFIPQIDFIKCLNKKFDFIGNTKNLQHSINQLNTLLNVKNFTISSENSNTLSYEDNVRFNDAFNRIYHDNKKLYDDYLKEDQKFYDNNFKN